MARIRFSRPETQASRMIADMATASLRTGQNFEQSLKLANRWQNIEYAAGRQGGDLWHLTREQAERFLDARSAEVGQSQLNQDRQALDALLHHTGQLGEDDKLAMVTSELPTRLSARAYTQQQVQAIMARQNDANRFATTLAYECGLRAHELLTIARADERPADPRDKALDNKFAVREPRENGIRYTVVGKGGLCREISIPASLAARLEALRRETPCTTYDRHIPYESRYDLNGGQRWSASFSKASNAALGRSTGAHGLRHSYAQERMQELQVVGQYSYDEARAIVSQELGHFRPEITDTYLR